MKKMKLLAMLMAALMLLSACNAVNVTEAATIGDTVVYKGEFMYYFMIGQSAAMQEAQRLGLTIATEKDWETVMLGDKTAAEYAKDEAIESLKSIMTLEKKAQEAGYVLTEKDMEEIKTTKETMIGQLGGIYEYENALSKMGISVDDFNKTIERSVYASGYATEYQMNDASLKATDEAAAERYKAEYVYVRHILISNQAPDATNEDAVIPEGEEAPEAVDYDADALDEAHEILDKLNAGGDFVALMKEHSDDGRDEAGNLQSDGYIMTNNGQMVKEFEDAAMALEEGKYTTEPVKTSYGYHIIKRFAAPTSGEQYNNTITTIKSTIEAENMENKINAWAEELGFAVNQKFIDRVKVQMEG